MRMTGKRRHSKPIEILSGRIDQLQARLQARLASHQSQAANTSAQQYAVYRNDPVGFARDVLQVTLTPDQSTFIPALLQPPYRVLVKSGHNVGKTFSAAVAVVWWYYTRDPGVVITTAPTQRDVVDLLWTEVRLLVQRAGLPNQFIGPAAPGMRSGEEHYAKGYTSSTGESFQGRHRPNMLFVFDEAEGVEATYWKTAGTMFQPDGTHAFLAILNPTTTTSQSYQEERAIGADGQRKWNVFTVSSLDHPNVLTGVTNRSLPAGEPQLPLPVPNAVSLEQVEEWLAGWFEPIPPDEADLDRDIQFPPLSNQWYRPSPDGESRVLGRRPTAGTYGVWSEALWRSACQAQLRWIQGEIPEIGHDSARYGDDRSETHVRCGPCSLHHEDHGGWDTVRQADRLMAIADQWADWATREHGVPITGARIPIKVDDTGVGGGVTDILAARGYNVLPVNAGERASDEEHYPRVRDELWFAVRDRAATGRLDLSRLTGKQQAQLETQALAPSWRPTMDRRRQVEPKEETKKRIGRSPDGMDALNLAFWSSSVAGVPQWIAPSENRSYRNRA